MLKNRIILLSVSAILIVALYFLPKAVVENDSQLQTEAESESSHNANADPHSATPKGVRNNINR